MLKVSVNTAVCWNTVPRGKMQRLIVEADRTIWARLHNVHSISPNLSVRVLTE